VDIDQINDNFVNYKFICIFNLNYLKNFNFNNFMEFFIDSFSFRNFSVFNNSQYLNLQIY